MTRLFQPAVMTGFARNQANQYNNQALITINDVANANEAKFYLGKRVAYIYKAAKRSKCFKSRQVPKRRSRTRIIWGRITKAHGGSGAVKARFSPNLPSQAIGRRVKVMLYPSTI